MGLEDPKSILVFSCPSHPSVRPSSPRAGSTSNSGVGGPETLESLACETCTGVEFNRTRFPDLGFDFDLVRSLSLISSSAAVSNDSVRSRRIPLPLVVANSERRCEGSVEDMLGSGTEGVISISISLSGLALLDRCEFDCMTSSRLILMF